MKVELTCAVTGPVNAFLSWKFFHPLSRLTYSIYLLHFSMIRIQLVSTKTPSHADYLNEASKIENFHSSYFYCYIKSTCNKVQRYGTLHEKFLMLKVPESTKEGGALKC
jgi:hypothetical protein